MELNRENIIKALECLLSTDDREFCEAKGCPFADCDSCVEDVLIASLSLINELTEENKARKASNIMLNTEIRRLGSENEAWQQRMIAEKEQADKAYHDLACEVEDLRAENERLRVENTLMINIMCSDIGDYPENTCRMRINLPPEYLSKDNHSPQTEYEIGEKVLKKSVEQVKADTVRKMQERLHERKVSYGNITFRVVPIDDIDQIAKEMLEGIE